jgi:DNA repair exonuclease SbcCD nuclease subunit
MVYNWEGMVRVLLLADTHLGFDLPVRPRIERRRRGHDFFENFDRVLDAAKDLAADLVVHGGDLFYRRRIPASLVQRAFLPLKRVADSGIPVYVVPGNHERSEIPYPMLALHPGIHIFDRPKTLVVEIDGSRIALAGFPFERTAIRDRFSSILAGASWQGVNADLHLLCVHQAFEGATVGPSDYTFRYSDDVVRMADVPNRFAAVLSGHIHRHQVLVRDLRGDVAPAPVFYPGSIERTSFAERDEAKGYMLLDFQKSAGGELALSSWEFLRLPARPMIIRDIHAGRFPSGRLRSVVIQAIDESPPDAVLRLRIHGKLSEQDRAVLAASNLRSLTPTTMNLEASLVDEAATFRRSGH